MNNHSLREVGKEEMLKYLLERDGISKEEVIEEIRRRDEENEGIPATIFSTDIAPLESIARYLREIKGKRIIEIAKILGKSSPAISQACKNSQSEKFEFPKTDILIPLKEFEDKNGLSILEIVVRFLKNRGMKFTEIGILLKKDVKTIWTVNKRAETKLGIGGGK